MNLQTFLDMLLEVELSQHAFSMKDEQGRIIKLKEILGLINRGLMDLHTRFLIKKGDLYLTVDTEEKTRYDISDKDIVDFAYDVSDPDNVLTEDLPLSVIKILEVWRENGKRIHLNTIHRYMGCNTVSNDEVRMLDKTTLKFHDVKSRYYISYHKGPKLIQIPDNLDLLVLEDVEIDITLEYMDALIYFVCSRLLAINPPMEGYAAPYSPSVTYAKQFLEECQRLDDLNLEIDGTGNTAHRFYDSTFP